MLVKLCKFIYENEEGLKFVKALFFGYKYNYNSNDLFYNGFLHPRIHKIIKVWKEQQVSICRLNYCNEITLFFFSHFSIRY